MSIKTLQQGFALMGASLSVGEDSVYVDYRGVTMVISLSLTEKELEGILFFLNLNTPNWYKLIKEALAEERKGGSEC